MDEKIILTTMCVVWDEVNNSIVMIDRKKGDWNGYTPPGGHLEFPESITDCAKREVKEETGLTVWDLEYKGVTHFVDTHDKKRFMVFNYFTENYKGKLTDGTYEGKPEWVKLTKIDNYTLAPGISERLDLFFENKIIEMYDIENNPDIDMQEIKI